MNSRSKTNYRRAGKNSIPCWLCTRDSAEMFPNYLRCPASKDLWFAVVDGKLKLILRGRDGKEIVLAGRSDNDE